MRIILFSVLILTAFILTACLPKVGTSKAPVGSDKFVKGSSVEGFPPVPLIPKAQVLESYGSKGNFGASFISDEKLAKVIKFYNESLPKLGWEATLKKRSETNYAFDIKNATQKGLVIANTAADGKKTAISIFVSPR